MDHTYPDVLVQCSAALMVRPGAVPPCCGGITFLCRLLLHALDTPMCPQHGTCVRVPSEIRAALYQSQKLDTASVGSKGAGNSRITLTVTHKT